MDLGTFTRERETKTTVRFKEDADPAKVGTVYLKKEVDEELGNPEKVKLTVEKA